MKNYILANVNLVHQRENVDTNVVKKLKIV